MYIYLKIAWPKVCLYKTRIWRRTAQKLATRHKIRFFPVNTDPFIVDVRRMCSITFLTFGRNTKCLLKKSAFNKSLTDQKVVSQ
jgi:hypothetical protein